MTPSPVTLEHRRPGTTSFDRVHALLKRTSASYVPPLDELVDLTDYATKLSRHAELVFASVDGRDAGLLSFYANDTAGRIAFFSTCGVAPDFAGRGIGGRLMREGVLLAASLGMTRVRFEVHRLNVNALSFHAHLGFHPPPESAAVRASHPDVVVLEQHCPSPGPRPDAASSGH